VRLLPGWLAGVEKITDAVLAIALGLKAISRNGTGVDSIDLAACQRRGVAVLRAEGANARGVAELAFGLALALQRSIPFSDARMKAGGWERCQGAELEGKTLGVVGTGKIGKLVARFGLAFDMKVIGADVYPDAALAKTPGFRDAAVGELLAASDVVTLHCPHEPSAKPLVDAAGLSSMRKGAVPVNAARWGLVDPDAALADGRLAGYAVDTFETEPPAAHPLLAHERVVTTPHVGAYTAETLARATRVAVDNLLAALGK